MYTTQRNNGNGNGNGRRGNGRRGRGPSALSRAGRQMVSAGFTKNVKYGGGSIKTRFESVKCNVKNLDPVLVKYNGREAGMYALVGSCNYSGGLVSAIGDALTHADKALKGLGIKAIRDTEEKKTTRSTWKPTGTGPTVEVMATSPLPSGPSSPLTSLQDAPPVAPDSLDSMLNGLNSSA